MSAVKAWMVCLLLAGWALGGCDLFPARGLQVTIKPSVVAGRPPLLVKLEASLPPGVIEPVSYEWHFGDSQGDLGNPVTHRYLYTGHYRVNLIATDALGNIGRAEVVIKVLDFARSSLSLPSGAGAVAAADFNSDGFADLAVANRIQGKLTIFQGQGNGGFGLSRTLGNGKNFSDVIGADFDKDGLADLAVSDLVNSVILIFTGNGKGAFKDPSSAQIYLENSLVASGPLAMSHGDFNGDGNTDVATVNQATDNVSVLLGDGEGRLALEHVFKPYRIGDVVALRSADVDRDGLDDLIVLNQSSRQAEVFLGRGDGTFVFHMEVAAGERPSDLVALDLDRDGYLDIAISNKEGKDISLWWGNASARFESPGRWQAGAAPDRIGAADIDGDGHTDLMVLDRNAGELVVVLAHGDRFQVESSRAFEAPVAYVLGGSLDAFVLADFNNDGQPDIALSEPQGVVDLLVNLNP